MQLKNYPVFQMSLLSLEWIGSGKVLLSYRIDDFLENVGRPC